MYGKTLKNFMKSLGPLPANWREYGGMSQEAIREKYFYSQPTIVLSDCKPASAPKGFLRYVDKYGCPPVCKEEGNNPMMKTNTAFAEINVSASNPKSDAMIQRDYLIGEFNMLAGWRDETYSKLRKMFNVDAPTKPESSQDLIDAFKNGDYTVDQTKVDKQKAFLAMDEDAQDEHWVSGIRDLYYGITFTKLPVADVKGFEAAVEEYKAYKTTVERKLHIVDPLAGLDLLTALSTWTPSNAPATPTLH